MRKIMLLFGLVLAVSFPAMAQEFPRFEAFAGYSYIRVNAANASGNLNGGSGSIALNLNHWLGAVADFGGYKLTSLNANGTNLAGIDGTAFSYLFGPRISFRGERWTPFAQALFGGRHFSNITCTGCTNPITTANDKFAMALGGGLDVKASKHFSIRLIQAEYLLVRATNQMTGASNNNNNARISAGIVIH